MRRFVYPAAAALAILAAVFLFGDRPEDPHRALPDTAAPDTGPEFSETAVNADTLAPNGHSEPSESADADNVVMDCTAQYEAQMRQLYDDVLTETRVEEIINEARTTLGKSTNPDLQVFAAQLAEQPEDRLSIFSHAIDAGSTTPHLLWSAVNTCLLNVKRLNCPIEDWLDRLLAVDAENSEAWMRAASYYYSAGDFDRAKSALDRAAIAYEANSYWYEDIMSAKAGADAVGGFSERASYLMAVGFAAAYPAPVKLYSDMCKTMSDKNPEWANSCAAYGEHAGSSGSTLTVRGTAKSIRANALIALGEDEESEEIKSLRTSTPPVSEREMLRYPDSITLYMAALQYGNESDALATLLAENERRKRQGVVPECGDFRFN